MSVMHPSSPSGRRPILIVEDNDMDLDLTMQSFAEHGVANPLVPCRDGDEAIAYIGAHGVWADPAIPVLVLLDLRLPKVDGLEVLRVARAHAVWKRVPFIVMTTSRDNADVGRAYDIGVNSYVVKPVDFMRFTEVVKEIRTYWLLMNESPFGGGPGDE